jgi:hypothetical protein
LVYDLAKTIVAQVAPAELPTFGATSRAYFADPEWAATIRHSRGGPLGFGTSDVVLLVAPAALVAMTEVARYLAKEVAGPALKRGGATAAGAVRRLFKPDADEQQPSDGPTALAGLTPDQWAAVKDIVVEVARLHRVPEDTAQLMGHAAVGMGQDPGAAGRR